MLNGRINRTRTTRSVRFFTGASLLAASVAIAAAQTGPVRLSGSVVDSTGAPVPGVSVVLVNARSQSKYEVKTDQNGRYEFVPLPADTYQLEVARAAFKKLENTVTLTGSAVRRDLTLALGSLQETINVKADREPSPVETLRDQSRAASASLSRAGFQRDLAACESSATGGRVRAPRKIKDVKPVYPAQARDAGVSGTVELQATIATDGTVSDVQVARSVSADLDNAAMEAVRQWEFDGTLLNCSPVPVTMNVSINFSK